MLARTLRHSSVGNSLIRLALVFVLVFSAAHVALHDVASGADGLVGYIECEACRFDQTPADLLPSALFVPLPLLAVALTVFAVRSAPSHSDLAYLARAPPLF